VLQCLLVESGARKPPAAAKPTNTAPRIAILGQMVLAGAPVSLLMIFLNNRNSLASTSTAIVCHASR
jgi:hypothetical protein